MKLIANLIRDIKIARKPWFLIDGPRGSGKSSLLADSDSAAPFKQIRPGVFLAHDSAAVYVDPSGNASTSASDKSANLFRRRVLRHKILRPRAFDGLIVVIDIRELSAMDAAAVDGTAADLRARADALVSSTGYGVPVYFVFGKIDLLDGFAEFFGGKEKGKIPVLGAVLGGRGANAATAPAPAAAFASRFREICADLSDICVRRIISADNPSRYDVNGRLYGFLTRFALAEAPIAAFLTEFFRPRGSDNARFCGFFFTSSKAGASSAALSRKVVCDVMPKTPYRAEDAFDGTWSRYLKRAGPYVFTAAVWAAFALLFVGGGLSDAARVNGLRTELAAIFESGASAANQFAALEKLRLSHEYFGGKFKHPWRFVFGTEGVRAETRRAYAAASERAAALPAAKFMESSINRRIAARTGELSASERRALYRELEAYLLLTGGNPVKGVNVDSVACTIAPAFKKPSGADGGAVMANIRMTVKLAAEGLYKNVPPDNALIEAARMRLAAAPPAAAVYASVMDKLSNMRRPLNMAQITGGGVMLKYGRDVSGLYTRDGWENVVLPELVKASKEPIKADWVTGPPAAASGEEKTLSELASLYADDLGRRWLDFIRNTYAGVQPNLPSLARDLDLLAARDCETGRMLAAVCSLATQPPADLSLSAASAKSASSIKGQAAGAMNKLRGGAALLGGDVRDPFAEARAASFAHVEAFLKNGAFDGYRNALGRLAADIRTCAGRNSYAPFITRGADDPLKECRVTLDRAYASMPPSVSAPLKRVLEPPLDIAAAALTKAVTEEIEESFRAEAVNPYVSKLMNRYPFDRKGNDASWSDFEEFFKPQSGTLWKYCGKNLSGVLERTSRGWEGAGGQSALPLTLNEELLKCLNRAERISDNFFKKDGSPKRHEIIFNPIKSSSGEVALLLGDRVFDFKTGLPATVVKQQGSETDEPIALRLTAADKAQEETRFTGEWSAVRLFESGKTDKLGNDRYRVNWRLNVRGIYTANITATVQCGTEALFDRTAVDGFAVPNRVFRNN